MAFEKREFSSNIRQEEPETLKAVAGEYQDGLTRRDFLRGTAVGLATILAGCAYPGLAERRGAREEKRELPKGIEAQWQLALERGIKEIQKNQELLKQYGQEQIDLLVAELRVFNITDYVQTVAALGGMESREIKGTIRKFSMYSTTGKTEDRVIGSSMGGFVSIGIGEWACWHGAFHAPTIHAVVRHELAHLFSDQGARLKPRHDESEGRKVIKIPNSLYEAWTELVARLSGRSQGTGVSLEPGYRGEILPTYVLSELIGRQNFFRVFLKDDPALLGKVVAEKIGPDAKQHLFNIHGGSSNASLQFIHRAFSAPEISPTRLAALIREGQSLGIDERIAHDRFGGISMTADLYPINDADETMSFSFDGFGDLPPLYQCDHERLPDKTKPPFEPIFSFSGYEMKGTQAQQDAWEDKLAEALRCIVTGAPSFVCWGSGNQDPRLLFDHGADQYISDQLATLSAIPSDSPELPARVEIVWQNVRSHAQKLVTEFYRRVYTKAGVNDLLVKN